MEKISTDTYLLFTGVKIHKSDGGECFRIDDPEITDKCWYYSQYRDFPYQEGKITWEAGDGYFTMTGKYASDHFLNVKLFRTKEDAIKFYEAIGVIKDEEPVLSPDPAKML